MELPATNPSSDREKLIQYGVLRLKIESALCDFLENVSDGDDFELTPETVFEAVADIFGLSQEKQGYVPAPVWGSPPTVTASTTTPPVVTTTPADPSYHQALRDFKRSLIEDAVERHGSIGEAAKRLGIARGYLYRVRARVSS